MPHAQHGKHAPAAIAAAVLTISDSRTTGTDASGDLLVQLLSGAGHTVLHRALLPDEPDRVRGWVQERLGDPACDGVITTGGTGISPRDRTLEAVATLHDRELPGFGELFRMLGYAEIGSAAMLSRAAGGVASGKFLFCLPGSPAAVRLAMEKLILPELGHLVAELRKHG